MTFLYAACLVLFYTMQAWFSYSKRLKSWLHTVLWNEIKKVGNKKPRKNRRQKKSVLSSFTHKRHVVFRVLTRKKDPQMKLMKIINMDIWVVGTSNQLFKKGS